MKKNHYVTMLFLLLFSTVSFAYNIKDFNTFKETNECIACDLVGAFIIGSNHTNAKLDNSNLSRVDAREINLSFSSLKNVNFTGANLGFAHLNHADLTGSDFTGAILAYANLEGAIGADLSKVANICGATLPDGKKANPCIY